MKKKDLLNSKLGRIISRKPLEQCSYRHRVRMNTLKAQHRHLILKSSVVNDNSSSSSSSSSNENDSSSVISNFSDEENLISVFNNTSNQDDVLAIDNNDNHMMNVIEDNGDNNFAPFRELNDPGMQELNDPALQDHLTPETENDEVANVDEEEIRAISFRTLLTETLSDARLSYSHEQCKAVLKLLRTHPCFSDIPADPRTVLGTPTGCAPIVPLAGGEYLHLGFKKKLKLILESIPFDNIPDILDVDVHTDGACPDRSRKINMWPIQIRVVNIFNCKPKMIGIFKGRKKPSSATDFFKPFIDEVLEVLDNGGFEFKKKIFPFVFRCFIADEPARAFSLGHKEHGATSPCSRCWLVGDWLRPGVMVYEGIHHEPRTEEEYRLRTDGEHFLEGDCPIGRLPIQQTEQVVLDSMHLLFLGLMEKIEQAIVDGKFSVSSKLPASFVAVLNRRLEVVKEYCPSDFARQPVNIEKHGSFKATEQRQILAYSGPVILNGLVNNAVYLHFLLLHSATRILIDPLSTEEQLSDAEKSLRIFVDKAAMVYGLEFLSYNVHALLHLADDVRMFGPLDSYSAFPYESNMIYLRKLCKKPSQHLQQIYRREAEMNDGSLHSASDSIKLLGAHKRGTLPQQFHRYNQFSKLKFGKLTFSVFQRDNTVMLEDSSICIIQNIISLGQNFFLVVKRFDQKVDFFDGVILSSSSCGVYHCFSLSDQIDYVELNKIVAKCFRMPYWSDIPSSNCVAGHFVVSKILSTQIA